MRWDPEGQNAISWDGIGRDGSHGMLTRSHPGSLISSGIPGDPEDPDDK
jgi:hypothetical protein